MPMSSRSSSARQKAAEGPSSAPFVGGPTPRPSVCTAHGPNGPARGAGVTGRRVVAAVAFLLLVVVVVVTIVTLAGDVPRLLAQLALFAVVLLAGWVAVTRSGWRRVVAAIVAIVAVVAVVPPPGRR